MQEWNLWRMKEIIESYGFDLRGFYYSQDDFTPKGTYYCCEDCDGPWEDHKARHYQEQVVEATKNHAKQISTEHLDTFKKKYPMLELLQK